MLASIGAKSIDDLFDEIPGELRCAGLTEVPAGQSEMAVSRLMAQYRQKRSREPPFLRAGRTGADPQLLEKAGT